MARHGRGSDQASEPVNRPTDPNRPATGRTAPVFHDADDRPRFTCAPTCARWRATCFHLFLRWRRQFAAAPTLAVISEDSPRFSVDPFYLYRTCSQVTSFTCSTTCLQVWRLAMIDQASPLLNPLLAGKRNLAR